MYSGSEPETSQPGGSVHNVRSVIARAGRRVALPVALAALSGCGSVPASVNPVTWWHELQGGQIAEQRPPPPGATDPYPNIASVPDRPAPLDPNIRRTIDQGLVADRANAQHEAAAAPIPDPAVERTRKRVKLHGEPPSPMDPRAALRFLPSRLPADPKAPFAPPALTEVSPGHFVAEFDPPAEAA